MKEEEYEFKKLFLPFTFKKGIAFLAIIGILAYFPTFFNGFVADDYFLVVNNALIHSLSNFSQLFLGALSSQGGQYAGLYYRPFMVLYFALIFPFFKINPFFYHSLQLLICIINSILLFRFFRYFFPLTISFFLSLVFLIHPINVETTAWISGANDFLFFLFGISALNLALNKKLSILKLSLIFIFLMSSYLSKETGLLFIPCLLIFGYFFNKKSFKKIFVISASSIVPYIILKLILAQNGLKSAPNLLAQMSLFERMLSIPSIIFYYLKNAFLPLFLVMPQGWVVTKLNFQDFFGPLIFDTFVLSGLVIGGIFVYRKMKTGIAAYALFFVWFVIGLLLHLQLFPLDYTASDRWFYFPFAGLLGLAGVFLNSFRKNLKVYKKIIIFAFIIYLCLLLVLTFRRTSLWNSGLSLWSNDVTYSTNNTELENALGFSLLEAERFSEAERHLKKSITLYPNSSNWTNLGVVYSRMGKNELATQALKKAINYKNYYLPYEDLSLHLYKTASYDESKRFTLSAIKSYPASSRLWLTLAAIEYKKKNYEEAFEAVKKSYLLGPDQYNVDLYNKLLPLVKK